jgi:hypothetical protein
LVESGFGQELVQFCPVRQREGIPATISDVTDYLTQRSITIGRRWVGRFIERHENELIVQKASVLDLSRHEVATGNLK